MYLKTYACVVLVGYCVYLNFSEIVEVIEQIFFNVQVFVNAFKHTSIVKYYTCTKERYYSFDAID